jgi:hypothetical protein
LELDLGLWLDGILSLRLDFRHLRDLRLWLLSLDLGLLLEVDIGSFPRALGYVYRGMRL